MKTLRACLNSRRNHEYPDSGYISISNPAYMYVFYETNTHTQISKHQRRSPGESHTTNYNTLYMYSTQVEAYSGSYSQMQYTT